MHWNLPKHLKDKIKNLYNLLPSDFDYKTYLLLYPDLTEAGITDEEQAIEHYILFGKREGRICQNIQPQTHNTIIKTKTIDNKIYKIKNINKLFNKIYVITLKEKNNQKLISEYLKKFKISFDFYYGIDGNNDDTVLNYYNNYLSWSIDDNRRHNLDNNPNRRIIMGPGAIALSLTYRDIFQEALEKKYKRILILEEDCLLDKNISMHLNNFINFKNDFDLLFLGASHHSWNNPKILNIPETSTNYYLAPHVLDGTFAIAYNCKILPELIKNMEIINAPIDSGPIRSILKNDNSYVIYPNIAIADTTPVSSISGKSRNLRNHKYKMNWDLSNICFTRGTLKVSIIIANHNSSKTIERCIKSIFNQTYKNFEIIIVDDNSSDSSVSIIKNYMKKYNCIKLIESNKNIGAYACRNIGIKNAEGFFVSLVDSDDILLSQKLEIDIYNYFNNSSYEIFFSNMYRSKNINLNKLLSDKSVLNAINKERKPHLYDTDKEYLYGHNTDWEYKFRFGLPTIFVEKSFFDKYGYWNEDYRYGMDLELIQRYIAIKYNEFIEHKSLWDLIYLYGGNRYDIYLSDTMNYVSFPQNENNATIKCDNKQREKIHSKCNKKLQNIIIKSNSKNKNCPKNKTEIFCIVKNEEDIIKYFIEYYLSIIDNITLIDNGSTDRTLDIAKNYPINIISNECDFKNKALIISNLIKNSKCDLAIPLDVDEFLFLEQNNKKIFNKKLIKKYLQNLSLNKGDKFQIKNIYENYPNTNNYWDINENYTKMIFVKEGFLAVDTGYHKGNTVTNNIKNIDISYCHFHFRSKNKWIQNTQQKLKARLGKDWNNLNILKEYSGESQHCVAEWLRFLETQEWHSLQPKVKFKFCNKMVFD